MDLMVLSLKVSIYFKLEINYGRENNSIWSWNKENIVIINNCDKENV